MRLLEDWQHKYIEKCLFNYNKLVNSPDDTDKQMVSAIQAALRYFKDQPHEIMMHEYYFNRTKYLRLYSPTRHYRYVCTELVYITEPQGYVLRREIIYRIAMVCFELHLFKSNLETV